MSYIVMSKMRFDSTHSHITQKLQFLLPDWLMVIGTRIAFYVFCACAKTKPCMAYVLPENRRMISSQHLWTINITKSYLINRYHTYVGCIGTFSP
jgi:hypothetical protein